MGTKQTAMQKRNWIRSVIQGADSRNLSLNENKLIATFCLEFNSTRKTAKEIINQFVLAGYLIREKGDLYTTQVYNDLKGGEKNVN